MVDKRIQNDIAKQSKSNPKVFWKYVKSKTKGKEPIGDLKYADEHGSTVLASTDVCRFLKCSLLAPQCTPRHLLRSKTSHIPRNFVTHTCPHPTRDSRFLASLCAAGTHTAVCVHMC